MRIFEDREGRSWVASVRERPGHDYKGRFHFYMEPRDDDSEGVSLLDVRWNSQRTAERTLSTASEVELRRRLRQARGRSGGAPTATPAADE